MAGQMRVTRAFLASAGAGLSLVAASVTVLFALSALVAVRGWPGIAPDGDGDRVTLADARLASAPTGGGDGAPGLAPASAPIVLGGRAEPAAAGSDAPSRPRRGRTGGARRIGITSPGGPAPAGRTPSAPATGPGAAAAPAPSSGGRTSGGSGEQAPRAAPVEEVTDTAARTVRGAGDAVGDTTDEVAPGAGEPVRRTTDRAAQAVQNAGKAADQAVQNVTGRVGGAVEHAGKGVGNAAKGDVEGAVKNVAGAVDGLLGGKPGQPAK
jgi:hypothetical protein